MLNINPANSDKLAKSVQRDYERDAEIHRLAQDSACRPRRTNNVKVGLILTTLVTAVIAISQYLI